jgi:hypothetical protein
MWLKKLLSKKVEIPAALSVKTFNRSTTCQTKKLLLLEISVGLKDY